MQEHAAASPERTLAALIAGQLDPTALDPEQALRLVELSQRHGLGQMLLWVVEQAGMDAATAPWADLASRRPRTRLRYLLRASTHTAVQSALDQAGIPAIWLKGFALAHTVYPSPATRTMGDLDLLVPYHRRRAALEVIRSVGYHDLGPEPFPGYHDLLHHYTLKGHVEDLVTLELHFRLVGPGDRFLSRDDLAWFWQQTRVVAYHSLHFTALAPEAQLLYLCAHAILHHGETAFLLRHYLDLHLLLTRTPRLDWSLVVERAVALRWTYAVERALRRARDFLATPLPTGLLAELAERRPAGEPIAHARRPQPTNHWETLMQNVRALQGRQRWRFLLGTLFPSAAYVRFNYHTRATWTLPWYYLRRCAFFAKEAARTARSRLAGDDTET